VYGKIHVDYILQPKLVMSPHSSGISWKEVFPKYGWEETGFHHESWHMERELELMDGELLKIRKLSTS
jgi:hypothetical protein